MTDQNSFVSDKDTSTEQKNQSNDNSFQTDNTDKKSVEGQLAIVQKRLDDQLDFIETLKGENKNLRENADASSKIDDLLSKLDASQRENTGQTQQTNTSPMNIDDLRKQGFLTKQDLDEKDLNSMYAENFQKVSSALIETYGEDKYLTVIQTKAQELGMTLEAVDELARTNPTATIKLMEASKAKGTTAPSTQGSLNTQAIDNYNSQQPDTTPKSVMFGASSKDMLNNWRAAGDTIKKQMEQGNQFG